MLILHECPPSGNCYKVRLTAAHLGQKLEVRRYDLLHGESRTPDFLERISPHGKVPVLEVDGRMLAESNAICTYLADGSDLIPADRFDRADMLHWMFWEQCAHEPNISTLRLWLRFVGIDALSDAQRAQISTKTIAGNAALGLMDRHLTDRTWFVGDSISLADICLFAYTHVADEAGFDLERFPAVIAWMERIILHPRHEPMVLAPELALAT
jgi:glutathione S-transferase